MFEFSFADSEVAAIEIDGAALRLRFAAAHVRLLAEPDRPVGHVGQLVLRLTPVPAQPLPAGLMGRLHGGQLWLDGQRHPRLAVPCTLAGVLRLELELPHQLTLVLPAQALSLQFEGEPRFIESLAC